MFRAGSHSNRIIFETGLLLLLLFLLLHPRGAYSLQSGQKCVDWIGLSGVHLPFHLDQHNLVGILGHVARMLVCSMDPKPILDEHP